MRSSLESAAKPLLALSQCFLYLILICYVSNKGGHKRRRVSLKNAAADIEINEHTVLASVARLKMAAPVLNHVLNCFFDLCC